ncbi:hypothetical protein JCM11641_001423 [Rhodosporidiobolus odoratus]
MTYQPPLHSLLNSTGSLPTSSNRSSTSLLSPDLAQLANPPRTQTVDQQLVQFVTHEIIHALLASTRHARIKREQYQRDIEDELASLDLLGPPSDELKKGKHWEKPKTKAEQERVQRVDDDEVRKRLERMGFKVGWSTAERLAKDRPLFPPQPPSATAPPNTPPTPDTLEVIKFLCKDVWTSLYDKQIDNLRTNHRGTWVLLDGNWRPLRGISRGASGDTEEGRETERWIGFLLAFPSGLLRGALANLGIYNVSILGESPGGVQATFQIKTISPSTPIPPSSVGAGGATASPAVGR